MNSFTRNINKAFDSISLASILFLLVIVAFNIIARQLHAISDGNISVMIPGVIELSKYTLLLIIFFALPRASSSGMVRVDILSNRLPKILAQFLNRLWLILMASIFTALFWLFTNKTIVTFNRGDATQDLQIPLFYIYALISLASFMTVISCLLTAFTKNKHIP